MLLARLSNKVAIGHPAACWVWKGAKDSKGYGQIARRGRLLSAHRLMYATFRSPLRPKDDWLHHLCENPLCVNPYHLEIVTPKEHKDAHAPSHCSRGHKLERKNNGVQYCRICRNERQVRNRRARFAEDPAYADHFRAVDRDRARVRNAAKKDAAARPDSVTIK